MQTLHSRVKLFDMLKVHLSANKNIVHVCPGCSAALATWESEMNGGWHITVVHATYEKPLESMTGHSSQKGGGNTASQFSASGYSRVHVGNRIYIQMGQSTTVQEILNSAGG